MKAPFTKLFFALCVALLLVVGASSVPSTTAEPTEAAAAEPTEAAAAELSEAATPQYECSEVDDETIANAVKEKIASTEGLYGQFINVTVSHRVVRLTGTVSSPSKKKLAGVTAGKVKCVVRVVNRLKVSPVIGIRYTCCCDGACYYSSRPCAPCAMVQTCIDAYKEATKGFQGDNPDAREKLYNCIDSKY